MPDLSDFRLGADVLASDGTKVGTVVSVIVDEKGFNPRALVVKDEGSLAGRLLSDEKLFTTDAEFASFSGDGKSLFVLVKDEFRTLDGETGKALPPPSNR